MQAINNDLQHNLTLINSYFAKNRPELDHKTMVLGRIVKIAEEFGELSNEVLSSIGMQRQSKLDKYERKHLEEEYADTLLALLLFGNYLEIDTNGVLSRKLDHKLQDFGLSAPQS